MIFQKKHIFFGLVCVALIASSSLVYFAEAVQGTISLKITGIGTRHGTPDNANLGILSTSTSNQEFAGQFTGYFWVEDMQGYITGHYTTIQCDGMHGPGGYMLTGIYLKAGNTTPTLLEGAPGNVHIADGLYEYTSIISPMTYIYKSTDINYQGVPNRYGDKPRFKIIIPAYAPPGTYSGTIVFSYYSY